MNRWKSVADFPSAELVSRSTMTTASTTARSTTAATTPATTASGSTTSAAISTAVWTIAGATFSRARRGYARDRITIEVRLIVGKISAALDGQRRSSSAFAVAWLHAFWSRLATTHLCALLLEDGLARKPNAITLNRKHLHQHLIALLELVAHILDAMLSHFADVQQPVGPRNDLNERPEIRQPGDRSQVSLPHLGGSRKIADDLQCLVRRSLIVRSHVDLTGIFDVDLHPGLLDDRANHFATGPNHVANLIHRNLQRVNSRSVSRDLLAMLGNPLAHLFEDVQASPLRLSQSLPHNLSGNAADFDVHLQRGDAVFGPSDFEIHVAVVILSPGNVGKDGVIVPFLHQPHRHASHRRPQRHARIHQRKRSPANRSHGRRPIRLQNVRNHPHGVRPILLGRKHRRNRPLCKCPMPNLPPPSSAQELNLSHRERGKVVMKQEALLGLAFEGFQALFVVAGA